MKLNIEFEVANNREADELIILLTFGTVHVAWQRWASTKR